MFTENNYGNWRLIIDEAHDGFYNMALDWTLLSCSNIPTLRFYTWDPPALSIGWSQVTTDLNIRAILDDSLDVVRRPTGGRAIFHQDELTYSVIFPYGHYMTKHSIMESYRIISEALVEGLKRLGINAEFGRGERNLYKNPSCFASASRYEVLVNGKKLIGSAQRRTKKGLIQQGTILLDKSYLDLVKYISAEGDKDLLALKSISLSEITDNGDDEQKLVLKMKEGFEKIFNVKLVKNSLKNDEVLFQKTLAYLNEYSPFSSKIVLDIKNL